MSLLTLLCCLFLASPGDDNVSPADLIRAETKQPETKAPAPVVQLVGERAPLVYYFSKERDAEIRKKYVPRLENEELNQKLREAFLYDQTVMPKAYQKDYNGIDYYQKAGLHAVSYNVSMAKNDYPHPELYGNANIEYPWGHTAGISDGVPNRTYNLIWLPPDTKVKVNVDGGTGFNYIHYPVGTTVFELLINPTIPDGGATYEVRTRTKTDMDPNKPWVPNVYVPFVSAKEYAEAIQPAQALAPSDLIQRQESRLRKFLKPLAMKTKHTKAADDVEAKLAVIPAIEPQETKRLIADRVFASKIGKEWDEDAAWITAEQDGQIVPKGYFGGLYEVGKNSCFNCHKTTMVAANKLESPRDWYGSVRGSADGIFSWYPFDQKAISYNGANSVTGRFPIDQRVAHFIEQR